MGSERDNGKGERKGEREREGEGEGEGEKEKDCYQVSYDASDGDMHVNRGSEMDGGYSVECMEKDVQQGHFRLPLLHSIEQQQKRPSIIPEEAATKANTANIVRDRSNSSITYNTYTGEGTTNEMTAVVYASNLDAPAVLQRRGKPSPRLSVTAPVSAPRYISSTPRDGDSTPSTPISPASPNPTYLPKLYGGSNSSASGTGQQGDTDSIGGNSTQGTICSSIQATHATQGRSWSRPRSSSTKKTVHGPSIDIVLSRSPLCMSRKTSTHGTGSYKAVPTSTVGTVGTVNLDDTGVHTHSADIGSIGGHSPPQSSPFSGILRKRSVSDHDIVPAESNCQFITKDTDSKELYDFSVSR